MDTIRSLDTGETVSRTDAGILALALESPVMQQAEGLHADVPTYDTAPFWRPYDGLKRGLDIVGSALLILLFLPVFIVIPLVLMTQGGAPVYRQLRVGRGGRMYTMFKFRTMVRDADTVLGDYLRDHPAAAEEWTSFQKLHDDPRITRFGMFLRRTSLDELPQFFNVLLGDMSLVGPRPLFIPQKAHFGRQLPAILACRPGISGLWQISGRSDLTFAERVPLDVYYVKRRSLWLDLRIIVLTPLAMFVRRDGV